MQHPEQNFFSEDHFGYVCHKGHWWNENNLQYHTSWDWIVPVCRKIESMGYIIEITFCLAGMCKIWNQNGVKGSGEHNEPIMAVLQAVYQFITWYNNQQKQTNGNDDIKI